MERVIKFRAWDKKSRIMSVEVTLFHGLKDWEKDRVEIMQFTGLIDSKGVEIFEGDIVRFSVNYGSKPICKDFVSWCDRRACWEVNSRGHLLASEYNIEVIGNIYEHPELLK